MRIKYQRLFVIFCIVPLLALVVTQTASSWSQLTVGSLTRITIASHSDRESRLPTISNDGTLIVFSSDSDFLHEGMPNDYRQLWLYNTKAMAFTRVTSVTHSMNSIPWQPTISADGSTVAFSSHNFLNENISSWQQEIWLYDTTQMTFTRVTTSSQGRSNGVPSLSADGTIVAFRSNEDLLNKGQPITHYELWLANTNSMTYTRITTGTGSYARTSTFPSLSADGTVVVFQSDADLLNQDIPQGQDEIWLYDVTSKEYTRITTASEPNRDSKNPHVSADGSLVVFDSDSDLLGEGISHDQREVWLFDTISKEYTRITNSSDSSRYSMGPKISADGKYIVFAGNSDLLNEGNISEFNFEIWLYDVEQKSLRRITTNANNGLSSYNPSIAVDDTNLNIVFTSKTEEQTPGVQTASEIWLYSNEAPNSNTAPIADAGDSRCVKTGDTIILDGSSSSDPDGDDLIYYWTLESSSEIFFTSALSVTTLMAPNITSILDFRLTVFDTAGLSDTDEVKIAINMDFPKVFLPLIVKD